MRCASAETAWLPVPVEVTRRQRPARAALAGRARPGGFLRRLGSRGVAAIEFAITLPVLVLLGLGMADLMQALRAQLRLEATAVQLGQIVSQCQRITNAGDVNNLYAHAQLLMGNLGPVTGSVSPRGVVIITAVRNVSNQNRVAWQVRSGANTSGFSSTVAGRTGNTAAQSGDTAAIAGGLVVPAEETLLVTEVMLSRDALILNGQSVAAFLPPVQRAATLFLSRAPDAVALQTLTNSGTADCTA
jgi:Flp pilus assembly protein TadG